MATKIGHPTAIKGAVDTLVPVLTESHGAALANGRV
jgi:hypothetical protein